MAKISTKFFSLLEKFVMKRFLNLYVLKQLKQAKVSCEKNIYFFYFNA